MKAETRSQTASPAARPGRMSAAASRMFITSARRKIILAVRYSRNTQRHRVMLAWKPTMHVYKRITSADKKIAETFRQADESEKLKQQARDPRDMQTRNDQDMICPGILKCLSSGVIEAGIISYNETGQHCRRLSVFNFRDGIKAPIAHARLLPLPALSMDWRSRRISFPATGWILSCRVQRPLGAQAVRPCRTIPGFHNCGALAIRPSL